MSLSGERPARCDDSGLKLLSLQEEAGHQVVHPEMDLITFFGQIKMRSDNTRLSIFQLIKSFHDFINLKNYKQKKE
ncbi:hypothetical protein D3OALGA1CA_746 [Olavius algarvensis associated proteobacterium Delta 3]|nr:hypothetical protein D3OALGA1CA_746 [Olavius algarvensis associated proteobacterium Delta 3]